MLLKLQLKFFLISFMLFLFLLLPFCKNHAKNTASKESQLMGSILNLTTGFDLTTMLVSISQNSILPAYSDMQDSTEALYKAASTYQSSPSTANLSSLRTAWDKAKTSLKRIEVFGFGPATLPLDYLVNIDYYPRFNLDTTKIENDEISIANSQTLNLSRISSFGVIKRGMAAAEYLIYDNGSGLSDLTSVNTALTANTRRIQYMVAVSEDLRDRTKLFNNEWQPKGNNFASQFVSGTNTFSSQRAVVDELVNQMIFQLSLIIDNKIGDPAGLSAKSGGKVDLNKLESKWSNHSLDDISANIEGIKLIYFANYKVTTGLIGLTAMVSNINPSLDSKIRTQIDQIEFQINLIKSESQTLRNAISTKASSVATLYNLTRTLRITLSTELIITLGSTVSISSSDGD